MLQFSLPAPGVAASAEAMSSANRIGASWAVAGPRSHFLATLSVVTSPPAGQPRVRIRWRRQFSEGTFREISYGTLSATGRGGTHTFPPPASAALVDSDVLVRPVPRHQIRGGDVPSGRAAAVIGPSLWAIAPALPPPCPPRHHLPCLRRKTRSGGLSLRRLKAALSSVVSVAITVNIVRGIGLDIGILRAQYRQALVQRYFDIICYGCFLLDPAEDLIHAKSLDVIANL